MGEIEKHKKKMSKKEIIHEMIEQFGTRSNPKNINLLHYLTNRSEPTSRKEIVDMMNLQESCISKYMEKLEKEGFVEQIKHEGTKELRYKFNVESKEILDKLHEMALDDIKKKIEEYKSFLEKYEPITKEKI